MKEDLIKKILELKGKQQTPEIKKQIQELQQLWDELDNRIYLMDVRNKKNNL